MASSSGTDEQQTAPNEAPRLHVDIPANKLPIVYSPEYNISFLGMEKLHPFDAGKWGKVYHFLKEAGLLSDERTVRALEVTNDELMVVHDKKYIASLKWSVNVASITEVPPVAFLPNFIVQRKVLRPFRFQTGGTIMAGKLAMDRGWAINLGGGFHHCSAERGGGFCAYADITLSVNFLFNKVEAVSKVMIIDLDAHQGNGYERDFMDDRRVYILDVYNRDIYPHDGFAKRAIRRKVELGHFVSDEEYLPLIESHIGKALNEFSPDIVVYNAGTDILESDPLGMLNISPQGIIDRDRIVFHAVRSKDIPLFMLTSGGYQKSTARIIADSILNLQKLGLIQTDSSGDVMESDPARLNNVGTSLERNVHTGTQCPDNHEDVQTVTTTNENLENIRESSDSKLDETRGQTLQENASKVCAIVTDGIGSIANE